MFRLTSVPVLGAVALSALLSVACSREGAGPRVTGLQVTQLDIVSEGTIAVSATFQGPADAVVHWDFGDGTGGDGRTLHHAYARGGDYDVTVTATSSNGAVDSAHAQATVRFPSHVAGRPCVEGQDATGWCWQELRVSDRALAGSFFVDAAHGWAYGAWGTILRTEDGGATWSAGRTGTLQAVASVRFSDPDHGVALLRQDLFGAARALRTTDGGLQWQPGGEVPLDWDATIAAYGAGVVLLSDGALSVDDGQSFGPATVGAYVVASGADCWSVGVSVQVYPGCAAPGQDRTPQVDGPGGLTFWNVAVPDGQHGLLRGAAFDVDGPTARWWSTADGGASWQGFTPANLPGSGYLITLNDALHGWAGDQSGASFVPYRTSDGGLAWMLVDLPASLVSPANDGSAVFRPVAALSAWASRGNAAGWTRDGGAHWHVVTVPAEAMATQGPEVLQWSEDDQVIELRFDGRIHRTADGGGTWQQVTGEDPRDSSGRWLQSAMWFSDANHGLYALGNGAIRRTSDGGLTWSRTDDAVSNRTGSVRLWFSTASDGWLMRDGRLLHTADGGATWSDGGAPPVARALVDMSWVDAGHGWLLDHDAGLFTTSDGGAHWTLLPAPVEGGAGWFSVAFSSTTTGVAYTGQYTLVRTTDGGAHWTRVTGFAPSGTPRLKFEGNQLWALFFGGPPRRSTDGGLTWTEVLTSGVSYDVSFGDPQHGWIVGSGTVSRTSDGGVTWSPPRLTGSEITSVFFTDKYTGWLVDGSGEPMATATGL